MPTTIYPVQINYITGACAATGDVIGPRINGANCLWYGYPLSTSRGNNSVGTRSIATVLGPTTGVEVDTFGTTNMAVSRPLAADVTISGSISVNIWAYESNMSANATIGVRVLKMSPSGTLTEIGKNVLGTELPTSSAVQTFSITPTSTLVKRGDRLVMWPYIKDATGTTMAASYYGYWKLGASSAGVDGDTYLTFAETITFEADPAQTQMFLTTTDLGIGTNGKEMWTSRGGGSTNCDSTSFSGYAAPAQIAAGGTVIEWFSKALSAATIQGAFVANIRGLLYNFSGYAPAIRVEVAICNGDGTGAVTYGWGGAHTYLTTTDTAYWIMVGGYTTSITNGQRIRLRVFIDDMVGGSYAQNAQINSGAARVTYNGASGGAAGDSWLLSPVALTVYSPPGQIGVGSIPPGEAWDAAGPGVEKYFAAKYYLTWADTDLPRIGLTDNQFLEEEILLMRPSRGGGTINIVNPTVAGPTSGVQLKDTDRASATSYRAPWGNVAVLSDGTMYYFEGFRLVRRSTTGHLAVVAGWLEADSNNGYGNDAYQDPSSGGFADRVGWDYPPGGMFVDNAEEFIWIADYHWIRKYNIATGEVINVADIDALMGNPLMSLAPICLDSTETYAYVGDRLFGCVYRYDIANNTAVLIAGDHNTGAGLYAGETDVTGVGASANLGYVTGLCISSDDSTLYFIGSYGPWGAGTTQEGYLRTLTPVPNAGATTLIAGDTTPGTLTWRDGTGTGAALGAPMSMVIDSADTLYWVEGEFVNNGFVSNIVHRLRKCVPSTRVVSSVAGGAGVIDQNGTGTGAGFWFPDNIGVQRGTTGPFYVVSGRGGTLRQVTAAGVSTRLHGETGGGYNSSPYWDRTSDGDGPTCWMTPQLAGVTIPASTAIAAHLFSQESNALANVAWRLKVQRCDSAGAVISTVVDGTSTVELPTTLGAVDFTLTTPSQVVLNDGDRLKATLYLDDDDSGNMAANYTATLRLNGIPANSADSFIGFPSLAVTEYAGVWPSTFYLTTTAASATGDTYGTTNKRVASPSAGSSATSVTTSPGQYLGHPGNSMLAGRVGANYTSPSTYSWWTAGISAVTFNRGDRIKAKFWAKQAADNRMCIGVRLARCSSTGARIEQLAYGRLERQMSLSQDVYEFTASVQRTVTFDNGDRIMITPLLAESDSVSPLGAGGGIVPNSNWTFWYNGADDASGANSCVMFDKLVEPATSTQTLSLALLTSTSSPYAPTVIPGPRTLGALDLLDGANAIYAPSFKQVSQLTIGELLDGGAALYAPTLLPQPVTVGALGLITSVSDIYALVLTKTGGMQPLEVPLIDGGAAIYDPTLGTVTGIGALALLDGQAELYVVTLVPKSSLGELGLIVSDSALYEPSLGSPVQAISDLALLDGAAALYEPTLAPGAANVLLQLLQSSSQVFALLAEKASPDDMTRHDPGALPPEWEQAPGIKYAASGGRYTGSAQAVHVIPKRYSGEPSGPEARVAQYSGGAAKVGVGQAKTETGTSPSQFDDSGISESKASQEITYRGVSQAIHVFGWDEHDWPPIDPIPACECNVDWEGGGLDYDHPFESFNRNSWNSWGVSDFGSEWEIHNWAGDYSLGVGPQQGFMGAGWLLPANQGGYVGVRAMPLKNENGEFIAYSVPWTNYHNHFTMKMRVKGGSGWYGFVHSIWFGVMAGEAENWAWKYWFNFQWRAYQNSPEWDDWIIVWECSALQYTRGKAWRAQDQNDPGWQTFDDPPEGSGLFDTDYHLFVICEYPSAYIDYITFAYEGNACADCEDPEDPNVQIRPFTPGYMPIFRKQIGDPTTNLDSYICTLESGAMVLDWHTRGAVQVWGGELIPYCGRTEEQIYGHGNTLGNVQQAWRHWDQTLSVRSGQTWDDLVDCLNEGRAIIIQGDYGVLSDAEKCQDNFDGGHAIAIFPYVSGGRILVGDPLCHDYHGMAMTSVRNYVEAMGEQVFGVHDPQPILFAVSRPWTP